METRLDLSVDEQYLILLQNLGQLGHTRHGPQPVNIHINLG